MPNLSLLDFEVALYELDQRHGGAGFTFASRQEQDELICAAINSNEYHLLPSLWKDAHMDLFERKLAALKEDKTVAHCELQDGLPPAIWGYYTQDSEWSGSNFIVRVMDVLK